MTLVASQGSGPAQLFARSGPRAHPAWLLWGGERADGCRTYFAIALKIDLKRHALQFPRSTGAIKKVRKALSSYHFWCGLMGFELCFFLMKEECPALQQTLGPRLGSSHNRFKSCPASEQR
jgi:hypothetical protein